MAQEEDEKEKESTEDAQAVIMNLKGGIG